jgi:hypothetical protein
MEKKGTIISLIAVVIVIGCAVGYIILSGIIAQDFNYVQIEVNPRIEFLCDKKFNVVSVYPINSDARIVLSDIDLIGLSIEDATRVFIDECARAGYIDVNGINNATNITVIDGLTQRLDVHVTQSVYKYFNENEIMASVTETYEDRSIFDEKKKNKVNCSNKYKLIKTMVDIDHSLSIDNLRKYSEVELVDMVEKRHKENPYTPTEDEVQQKTKRILSNAKYYDKHKQAITQFTQKEFSDLFQDFQKNSSKKHLENFDKQYTLWQEKHIN